MDKGFERLYKCQTYPQTLQSKHNLEVPASNKNKTEKPNISIRIAFHHFTMCSENSDQN